jgi:uncharacterized membrane protein YfcA
METLLMLLCGAAGGILGGMGMGGGTLLIPLLTVFFGVPQHTAQAVNLAAFIPMSVGALIFHFKNKLPDVKKAFLIVVPAAVTSAGGALLAQSVKSGTLKVYFGIFLILLAAFQGACAIASAVKKKREKRTFPYVRTRRG